MPDAGSSWNPSLEELRSIRDASRELVKETPVFSMGQLSRRCGGEIWVKAENLQRTGSFKIRGTTAKLRASAGRRGVVAGSAGNHGQALAYAARARGLPCTVFMPAQAPISKMEAVAGFGASVRPGGDSVDECVAAARRLAEAEDLLFVHPYDDLDVIKGQAGLGIELAEQVPDLRRVIVPVGGGGLISGVAAALDDRQQKVEIIGVQASGCPAYVRSIESGRPVEVEQSSTIADGIAVKRPGDLTFDLVERWIDEIVVVDDDAIAEAMVLLVESAKLVVEGAGAVVVAALATGAVTPATFGTTVAVLSGGNVDAHVLASVVNRHQTGIGRRTRLFSRISDRPGGLADFLRTVAIAGGNVLDVTHVRDGVALHVGETGVEVLVESRDEGHRRKLVARIRDAGYAIDELGREEQDD